MYQIAGSGVLLQFGNPKHDQPDVAGVRLRRVRVPVDRRHGRPSDLRRAAIRHHQPLVPDRERCPGSAGAVLGDQPVQGVDRRRDHRNAVVRSRTGVQESAAGPASASPTVPVGVGMIAGQCSTVVRNRIIFYIRRCSVVDRIYCLDNDYSVFMLISLKIRANSTFLHYNMRVADELKSVESATKMKKKKRFRVYDRHFKLCNKKKKKRKKVKQHYRYTFRA